MPSRRSRTAGAERARASDCLGGPSRPFPDGPAFQDGLELPRCGRKVRLIQFEPETVILLQVIWGDFDLYVDLTQVPPVKP
jgi:hypothetical protein